ncbi:exocyst complex component [Trifolium pratense]|uniref:Exocyst subunit Exo70 family protein n=1 Tax=Trifolium pratense TaxID=57577 RepID=A0A2K3P580_TRIPR|nr:exocyst complex component [Trifolium pratense]
MTSMLHQIVRWTMQPKIWRFVCFVSSIVGLLCYALSSSFNHLFGKWNLSKIFLYSVVSFIICFAILFANKCHTSGTTSIRLKVHLVFFVFTITTVYSFFFDKSNGKPDLYSLISCAAFAIMSLGLSKQTHFGFEVDLLYFFCGYLTLQLMKIKFFLVIVGASFSYSLILLRFYLGNPTESGHIGYQIQDQHSVVIQVNEDLEEDNTFESAPVMTFDALQGNMDLGSAIQVNLPPQQGNSDDGIHIKLDNFKRDLAKMNGKLNHVIWQQFMMLNQELVPRSYIWTPADKIMGIESIIYDLQKIVNKMMEDGFRSECCNMFNIFRSKFLNKCLCRLGLHEVNFRDVDNKSFGNLIKAFHTALRILLPNEKWIWQRVFFGFSLENSIFSSLEWRRMEIELWVKFMMLETFIRYNMSQETFGCGVHPLTREVMKCIKDASKDKDNATYFHIPEMIQLLESNLKAKSKNRINPASGYLFMLNNNRYIQLVARCDSLRLLLGEDWTQLQAFKVRRNNRDYLRFSWNKVIFNLMKNNKSVDRNVAIESMSLFHLNFSDICKAQSTCWVLDERLRITMIRYLKEMLLPLYENFIGWFKDVLGKVDVDQYIEYEMSNIEDRLNHLFLGNKSTKESSSVTQYTQGSNSIMNAERLKVTEEKYRFGARKRV